MKYWIYESPPHGYARVHQANCRYCRDGHGNQRIEFHRSGTWLGAFGSLDAALSFASARERRSVVVCRRCIGEGLEWGENAGPA